MDGSSLLESRIAKMPLNTMYGQSASSKISNAHVLVVGAGGVGCELVKNLALSSFGAITLIDLDTIDVSNLNRQFLFRRKHVGKSKAVEAALAIQAMVPGTEVTGITGNIKESRFDVVFFKQFTLVCNALDNLEARRHVNRMCHAANVPLVESGSTGYNGQCSVIGHGYECYDCVERLPQKTYAVCTIRSTPEKPVHCVVWAKFLYELVFGKADDGNVLQDLDGGGTQTAVEQDSGSETSEQLSAMNGVVANGSNEPITSASSGDASHKPRGKRVRFIDGDTPHIFAKRLCERVYIDDIEEQRSMTDLWRARSPPTTYDVFAAAERSPVNLKDVDLLDQTAWDAETSAAILVATLKHVTETRSTEVGSLSFDKDDRDSMLFVAAATNLRANAYGVPLQSPFTIKGIAGNIIHAIATTNAMVGGLVVLEALKIATSDGNLESCRTTFVSKAPRGSRVRRVLCPEKLQKPNEQCFVCSRGQLHLTIDTEKNSLKSLFAFVLEGKMSVLKPDVYLTTGENSNILFENGSDLSEEERLDYDANLKKTLKELKVESGSRLDISDFVQCLTCTVHITHKANLLEDQPVEERFILTGNAPAADELANGSVKEDRSTEDVDNDEVEEVPVGQEDAIQASGDTGENKEAVGQKRTREVGDGQNVEPEAKKAREDDGR